MKNISEIFKKSDMRFLASWFLPVLSCSINILADGVFVAQKLGGEALAAIHFSFPVCLALWAIGSLIASGTALQASKAMEDHEFHRAWTLYQVAVFWCCLASVLVMVPGLLFLEPLAGFLCSSGDAACMVTEYVGVTLAGALPQICLGIPFWYLGVDGRDGQVAAMAAVTGIGNILLDAVFLYVIDMGVMGAALASVTAAGAGCFLGFVRLCDESSRFLFGFCAGGEGVSAWDVARLGSPGAVSYLLLLWGSRVLLSYFEKKSWRFLFWEGIGILALWLFFAAIYRCSRPNDQGHGKDEGLPEEFWCKWDSEGYITEERLKQ